MKSTGACKLSARRVTLAFCVNALTLEALCWTETEFADLDLGDARLNRRARTLMERLVARPTAGVPQACRGWGGTMAVYRFFDNDGVE